MEALSNIGAWIAENEAMLSGLAALIVVTGVIFTPLGAGVRRLLGRDQPSDPPQQAPEAGAPVEDAPRRPAPTMTGLPSIAVLPLVSMSPQPEHEFLSDGLSEDITTALAANRHLNVVSRNSTFAYKGQSPDIREVGRELGVRYVLEGSLRLIGDVVRITIQLIAANDGTHVFAEKYDIPASGSAAEQDQLVADIAGALSVQIVRAERLQSLSIPDEEAEPWDLLMKGTYYIAHGSPRREQADRAVQQLQRALELEPDVPYTQACLAWTLFMCAINGWTHDPFGALHQGQKHLDAALNLDSTDALTQFYVGCASMYSGKHERAIRFLEQSLTSNPHQPEALCNLALSHSYLGQFEKAYECYERADRSVNAEVGGAYRWYRGITLCLDERFEDAIEVLESVVEQIPTYAAARVMLATAYEGVGNSARARSEVVRASETDPELYLPGLELQFRAHPDPEQAAARVDMLRRYWPVEPEAAS